MRMTDAQLARFDELGFLYLPECFSADEIATMKRASARILAMRRPEVWREKDGSPRSAFACTRYSEPCDILAHDARLVEPVEQLFGEPCYVHQFKINAKAAFTGEVWQWHQDFPTWHADDGMPEARAMNIAVFLDDVLPINGPLMLIPRSHRSGAIPAAQDRDTTTWPLWTLDQQTVTDLVEANGIETPTGRAGGVLMFHANLVHGSAGNMTPYPRRIVYLTLSAVSNAITKPTRAEFIAQQDFTPIRANDPSVFRAFAERELETEAA